ncbi:MAG: hypothetical protein AAGU14_02385 [Eubacteriaceae bacterium]
MKSKLEKFASAVCKTFTVLLGIFCLLFFAFNGPKVLKHHIQSGMSLVTVTYNDELLNTDEYAITVTMNNKSISAIDGNNGYSFSADYGEIKGTITTKDSKTIEFGFFNSNNWHNIQIHIYISKQGNNNLIKQTVVYNTDDDIIDVLKKMQF